MFHDDADKKGGDRLVKKTGIRCQAGQSGVRLRPSVASLRKCPRSCNRVSRFVQLSNELPNKIIGDFQVAIHSKIIRYTLAVCWYRFINAFPNNQQQTRKALVACHNDTSTTQHTDAPENRLFSICPQRRCSTGGELLIPLIHKLIASINRLSEMSLACARI